MVIPPILGLWNKVVTMFRFNCNGYSTKTRFLELHDAIAVT
jgi:hypothetical protein